MGTNSSRSTKFGMTWMPHCGVSTKFSAVRRARSCETAVTASLPVNAYCVNGAYVGSLPTSVMSVPCSVVTTRGTGWFPADRAASRATRALIACGIA
jgi:hypothetical protein